MGDETLLSEECMNPQYNPSAYQSYSEQTQLNLVLVQLLVSSALKLCMSCFYILLSWINCISAEKIEWRCNWLWSSWRLGVSYRWKLWWWCNSCFLACKTFLFIFLSSNMIRHCAYYWLKSFVGSSFQGISEIYRLHDKLAASYRFGGESSEWLLPLHSSVAAADQKKVFQKSPENMRKVCSIFIDDFVLGTWFNILVKLFFFRRRN